MADWVDSLSDAEVAALAASVEAELADVLADVTLYFKLCKKTPAISCT